MDEDSLPYVLDCHDHYIWLACDDGEKNEIDGTEEDPLYR